MPIRFAGTRPRSCAPCTTKRPAATGLSPAMLSRTQSFAATRAKRNTSAASRPAAAATSARTASSSGAVRKWMATCQRPPPLSARLTAALSTGSPPPRASAIRRALCSSVSRHATGVAAGEEFIGSPDVFRPLPAIHIGERDGLAEISGRLMSTTPSFGFPQIINDSRTGFSQETNCLVMLGLGRSVHVFRSEAAQRRGWPGRARP